MPKYRAFLRCKKCKNTTFFLSKESKDYENEAEAVQYETLAHDGFGWDVNTFDIVCALCGGDPEVYLQPIEH